MTELGKAIGAIVKKHRLKKEWNHVKLQEEAGLATGYVSKIEAGMFNNPQFTTLIKIANALGFDLNEFADLYK